VGKAKEFQEDNALTRRLYEGILRALSEDALKTKAV
jgi:hypothetical protein